MRQKWTQFVQLNWKDYVPTKSSYLCSVHFNDSCFEQKTVSLMDTTGEAIDFSSVPTKTAVVPHTSYLTDQKRRRVKTFFNYSVLISSQVALF